MRLMVIGHLNGHISQAGKIALKRGAKVLHCEDTRDAIGALLNGRGADLVMIDVKQEIANFIEELDNARIHIPVIACGVENDARAAVKAIQSGAKEYVPLPPDADLIAAILEAVSDDNSAMIADDPAMKPIMNLANKIAPSEATIMITGESGTGKEVMSSYIHNKSKRKDAAFIAVNCAAIPENLLESELFGHEKGAFTGASSLRQGRFEQANGGTLFLDEIGDASLEVQALLLKVVDERIYQRVGGKGMLKANTRFIFATNRDLEKMVRLGTFRKDLYDRISAIVIKMPSQRDRKVDIPFICQSMTDRLKEENGKNINYNDFPQDLKDYLTSGEIEGNIRGIENHLIKLMSLSKTLKNGKLDYAGWKEKFGQNKRLNSLSSAEINKSSIQDLIDALASKVEDSEWPGLPNLKKIIEKKMVQKVHEKSDDNKVRAKLLGISLQSIYQKNDKYIKG